MSSNLTLYELTAEQQYLEDLLIENGGELTPELESALNDNSVALTAKVDGYHHIIRRLESQGAAFKAAKDEFAAKQKVCDNSVKRIKEHLAGTMSANGVTKLEGELAKVSLRRTEVVEVYDEDALMRPYLDHINAFMASLPPYITAKVELNKTALKERIKAGDALAGAALADSYSAIVK